MIYTKYVKQIILFICLLYSLQAHSCIRSTSGEKYDELIKIVHIEDNKYRVSIPAKIGPLTSTPVMDLLYKGMTFKEMVNNLHSLSREIDLVKVNDEFVGIFSINNKWGDEQSINVYWPPVFSGGCGIRASQAVPNNVNDFTSKNTPE